MHDPKNKNCQKSTCDEHHSALRNPIFGGTHECDCTCPEQKEEWEEEFMPIAEKLENVCTDYAPVEATWDFIRTQISLAEIRGREKQQKEDYEVAKAQQEKAFKSGAEMGEERGRKQGEADGAKRMTAKVRGVLMLYPQEVHDELSVVLKDYLDELSTLTQKS